MLFKEKSSVLAWLVLLLIFLMYLPALRMYMFGDGYVLLDYCYSGWRHPALFFDLINNYFFRPLVNISHLLNYTLFGEQTAFYILITLGIHLLNVFLLYRLMLKVTGKAHMAILTMLLYGTSPLYSGATLESGFAASPDITLLCFFLGILLCFARTQRVFGFVNRVFIFLCLLGAIGSKEAWVIIPLSVLSFLLLVMNYPLRKALLAVFPMSLLVIIYVIPLFLMPWLSSKSSAFAYSGFDLENLTAMLAKACFLLCRYIGLGDYFYGDAWQYLVILLVVAGFLLALILLNNKLALWGFCVMVLAHIPTLPIPYAPSRFNYIPLVGFWIMIVAFADQIIRKLKPTAAYLQQLVIGLFIGSVIVYNIIMLQWEIKDYSRLGEACQTIVSMYKPIKDQVRLNQPVLFINQGTRRPIQEVEQSLQGNLKLLFARPEALWQLVQFAPLANFAGTPFKQRMFPVQAEDFEKILHTPFQLLIFTDQGFFWGTPEMRQALQQFYRTHRQLPAQAGMYRLIPVE